MRVKSVTGKSVVMGVLITAAAYALFSFLVAGLCLWEMVGEKEMAAVYFLIGLLGVFCSAVFSKCVLKMKKMLSLLVALLVYAAVVFLCRGGETTTVHVWTYAGCGAGAVAALLSGTGKKRERKGAGMKRRKK